MISHTHLKLAAAMLLAAGTAASAQSLSTGFNGTTTTSGTWMGVFFDVTALHQDGITITSWDVDSNQSVGTPLTFRIWITPHSFVGHHTNEASWTLVGEVQGSSMGSSNPTAVNIGDIFIPSGQTYGVRIGVDTGALRYKSATITNNQPIFANADAQIDLTNGVAQGTIWTGGLSPRGFNGTIYYDTGNTATFGACCLPSGACEDLSESMCLGNGGTFQGAGTDCATTPSCPQPPTGACCLNEGTCVIDWEGGCLAQGGIYHGDGTTCATIPSCPHWITSTFDGTSSSSGAGAGAYFDVLALDPQGITVDAFDINSAASAGTEITAHVYYKPGSFVGFETDPSAWILLGEVQTTAAGPGQPTPVLIGGLPIPSGETYGLRVGTTSTGGVRYSASTSTEPFHANSQIQLNMGLVQTQLFAGSLFGTYPTSLRGWNGTLYYSLGAVVTTGACCMPDGTCQELTEISCTGQNGTYNGDNTTCATIPPCPVGACCLNDGTCVETAEAGCLAQGGTYQGDNTECATAPCPQLGACCLPLGCSELLEVDCLAQGGTFEGENTTCPGNCPVPQFVVAPNSYATEGGNAGLNTALRDEPRVYQQVIAASEFQSIPVGATIEGLTWRIRSTASYTTWPEVPANWGRFDVQVSTSVNAPGSLSITFDDNIAGDVVMARSGPLTIPAMTFPGGAASPALNDFGYVITFDTPFEYQGGDLLITVRHDGNDTGTNRFMDSISTAGAGYGTLVQAMSATGDPNAIAGSQASFSIMLLTVGDGEPACYANCDGSTVEPVLNVDDFTCFINEFAAAQALPHEQQIGHYANCDGSTIAPVLNVDDFTCFINAYAAGCP